MNEEDQEGGRVVVTFFGKLEVDIGHHVGKRGTPPKPDPEGIKGYCSVGGCNRKAKPHHFGTCGRQKCLRLVSKT
jgi:hypothetical protein